MTRPHPKLLVAIAELDDAASLCALLHMAAKDLPKYERDALMAGLDMLVSQLSAARGVIEEAGNDA